MTHSFWDTRYAEPGNAYGVAPNAFVKETLAALVTPGGSVLDVGSGEGRNACWASDLGYRVTAVDQSQVGLDKMSRRCPSVEAVQADLCSWRPGRTWNAVLCVFVHVEPESRAPFFAMLHDVVAPGGILIAEWFAPRHLSEGHSGGGPRQARMLMSMEDVEQLLPGGHFERLETVDVRLDEGPYHRGSAVVVRAIWRRG